MTAHKHAALFRAIADGDDLRKWQCLRDTWGDDWSDIEQGRLAGIAHNPDEWEVRRKPGATCSNAQQERKPHTEVTVQEILGLWNKLCDREKEVRRILGVPEP